MAERLGYNRNMPKLKAKSADGIGMPESPGELRRLIAAGEEAARQKAAAGKARNRPRAFAGTRMATRAEYDPNVAVRIVERVSMGETLSRITLEPGMPNRRQFHIWTLTHPELREAWTAARRLKASSLFDEALDLARGLTTTKWVAGDSAKVNALRTAIDHLRWSASKLNPQEYGDKSLATPALQIQIITGLDLGRDASKDVVDANFTYELSATVPVPQPPAAQAEAADGEDRKD